jgi:hypothetical protein
MKNKTLFAFSSLLLLLAISSARAQENALLDLLVKKKVLTSREAEEVRADLVKEQPAAQPNRIGVGSWVQEMKIGGDIRFRYQYDNRDLQAINPATGKSFGQGSQNSRWRFRLRLNDEFKLTDNWFGGVRLETNIASDSGMQTYGDPATGSGFSKYPIFISRAYLGWNATDWLTIVAGKQPNPFYTTELVWDPDINPDGLVQTVRFHKLFASSQKDEGYPEDGKAVTLAPPTQPWELTMNLGEFIFADNNENGGRASEPGLQDNDISNDAYLFVGQLVGTWHFDKSLSATVAPGFMFYNAARISNATDANAFTDTAPAPTAGTSIVAPFLGETRNLEIITAPGDVSFKLWNIPTKVYWDFAWNTRGRRRAEEIYGLAKEYRATTVAGANGKPVRVNTQHTGVDDFAYLAGAQLGENRKKGDLSLNVSYRQTGIASLDPNLNDSDFALSELNTRGIKTSLFYNLTDFATFGVSYMYAWNLRDDLLGGFATSGPSGGIADSNAMHVLQVDLNVKF